MFTLGPPGYAPVTMGSFYSTTEVPQTQVFNFKLFHPKISLEMKGRAYSNLL